MSESKATMTPWDSQADISIAARAIWSAGGARPRRFPEGRICATPGCPTILSIYNRAEVCADHQEVKPRPPRGGRRRTEDSPADRCFIILGDFCRI